MSDFVLQAFTQLILDHTSESALGPSALKDFVILLGTVCEQRVSDCLSRSRNDINKGLGGGGLVGLEAAVLKCQQARQQDIVSISEDDIQERGF